MGLRIQKRINAGKGRSVNLSKTGVSVSNRSDRGSVGVSRRGVHGGVRLMRGVSWLWGKR